MSVPILSNRQRPSVALISPFSEPQSSAAHEPMQGYSGVGLPPIGIDSVFNQRSELFNAGVDPDSYYNTTLGAGDISPSGLPYVSDVKVGRTRRGHAIVASMQPDSFARTDSPVRPQGFYSYSLPGMVDGYPLVLEPGMSQKRVAQVLTHLRDGAYLSASLTKRLSATLLAYAPKEKVLAYLIARFRWSAAGKIDLSFHLKGLPLGGSRWQDLCCTHAAARCCTNAIHVLANGKGKRIRAWTAEAWSARTVFCLHHNAGLCDMVGRQ